MKRKGITAFVLMIMLFLAGACAQKQDEQPGYAYKVYYINSDETAIFSSEYSTREEDQEALLKELLEQLGTVPEKLEYKAPVSGAVKLRSYTINKDQLVLDFEESYRSQSATTEVLTRAAIVRTLTQVKGIQYVSFQINSEPLTDALGSLVGVMNADLFIDNEGNEINTYERVKLTLYLANEEGNKLTTVTRSVVYNSNIPMERLILEQLIAGPLEGEKAYPTMNQNTKGVSVNVKDGTCYVNFDNTFLTQTCPVSSEVTIYSITNSLAEQPGINKVQISINGDANVNYKENINLSTFFERNLGLLE